ncbi:AbfB domain-containing protein [Streptomyces sp. NBC_00564]|uniref:AbfB domain-containing protein n=1 Tax=unclassified Streptomyces TaxID=2593676 RepID=UPI0032485F46|nr:AbfB domain-containing protein [Streptomyces sp. NBC_00564]
MVQAATGSVVTAAALGPDLGRHLAHVRRVEAGNPGVLGPVAATSSGLAKQEATFRFVTGVADSHCYSLKDASGRCLRHYAFRIRLDANDGSAGAGPRTEAVRPGHRRSRASASAGLRRLLACLPSGWAGTETGGP